MLKLFAWLLFTILHSNQIIQWLKYEVNKHIWLYGRKYPMLVKHIHKDMDGCDDEVSKLQFCFVWGNNNCLPNLTSRHPSHVVFLPLSSYFCHNIEGITYECKNSSI